MGGPGRAGPPPRPKSDLFSGCPPPLRPPLRMGPEAPHCPCRKNFPKAPPSKFQWPPFKIRRPPSEMNLFLYDFLEFTQILHRNFFFSKFFLRKTFVGIWRPFFFLEINFQAKAPPGPPMVSIGGPPRPPHRHPGSPPPHLPQFRRAPSTKALEGGRRLEGAPGPP